MKHKKIRISLAVLFIILCAIFMLCIFKLSSEDGIESNQRSAIVNETIKKEVMAHFDERGVQFIDKVKYFIILHSPYGSNWNTNIRKLAHFSIYFALACMVYIALTIANVKKGRRFLITIFVCFFFAMSDEFHQSFTSGRGASMNDVLLDSFGGICAAGCMTLLTTLGNPIQRIVKKDRM